MRLLWSLPAVVILSLGPGLASSQADGLATYVPLEGAPPALQADLLAVDPDASIIRPLDYVQRGDKFIVPSSTGITAREAWVQKLADWVEPLTTVDGTLPLVEPGEILLVETFGYVELSKPGVKSKYGKPITANPGDIVPSKSQLAAKEEASAALLIGGLISVRLGEDTIAAIEHRVVGEPGSQIWETSITLEQGYVFCKIGMKGGVETKFSVRTPAGRAVAEGTDFVARYEEKRLTVGVAGGTVSLLNNANQKVASGTSLKKTSLRVIHLPEVAEPIERMTLDSKFLQDLLEFIPLLNLKVKSLRSKLEVGNSLKSNEDKYLDKVSKISYLQKVRRE